MSTSHKQPHAEQTASEPRDPVWHTEHTLHTVIINRAGMINVRVRYFRLFLPVSAPPITFSPGQWLDVYVPGLDKPGGFTITTPPSKSAGQKSLRYVDLAIQDSPLPGSPAAWLWNAYNTRTILGTELKVRVGGSFVWPPALYSVTAAAGPDGAPKQQPKRVVFVAGGIGVNPLVSMLAAIAEEEETRRKLEGAGDEPQRIEVNFLYSVRMADALAPMNGELASLEIEVEDDYDDDSEDEEEPRGPFAHKIPFLELIAGDIYGRKKVKGNFQLFLTGECDKDVREVVACNEIDVPYAARRMTVDDVRKALGFPEEWKDSVVYICGVPTMIDQFVEELTNPREGLAMARERVLYEKWW